MSDDITFTSRGGLTLLGLKFQELGLWNPVRDFVQIKQKVCVHQPLDKLLDCFINILAGGHGLVEVNTLVRTDSAIQRAFGRQVCAEQSTMSDTLDACSSQNVDELRQAVQALICQHSRSYAHDYQTQWQLLDIDTTGLPAGRLGEGVTKGYFAGRKSCRGRQLGRVIASRYDEVIVDRLYPGKRQLETSLSELVTAAENTLKLDEKRRSRTVLRIDAGGGSETNLNWMLQRNYQVLAKVHNWKRVMKLEQSVTRWLTDPTLPEREIGWIETPHAYVRPTRQLAVRKRKPSGKWIHQVLVFNLNDDVLFELAQRPKPALSNESEMAWIALAAYDLRGGGAETQNKGDKQGLGLSHRNKHRFTAQEMLVLLAQLAHNFVIWTRNDLAQADQRFRQYGIQRTVRDVFQIPGRVQIDAHGRIVAITLRECHPLAQSVQAAFTLRRPRDDLSLNLGKI
jgi:hypothetical protein